MGQSVILDMSRFICLAVCEGGSEFVGDGVVLGHEETEVDDGHRLFEPRVQRGGRKLGRTHCREAFPRLRGSVIDEVVHA